VGGCGCGVGGLPHTPHPPNPQPPIPNPQLKIFNLFDKRI